MIWNRYANSSGTRFTMPVKQINFSTINKDISLPLQEYRNISRIHIRFNDALAILCTGVETRWDSGVQGVFARSFRFPRKFPRGKFMSFYIGCSSPPHRPSFGRPTARRMQYPPNGVWNYPLRRAYSSVTFNIGENREILAGRMHNSRRL